MKIGEIKPLEMLELEIVRGETTRIIKTKIESIESETEIIIVLPGEIKLRKTDGLKITYSKDSKLLTFSCEFKEEISELSFNLVKISSECHGESCNRRGGYRLKCYLNAAIKDHKEDIACICTDISVNGVCIETKKDIPLEKHIDLSIEIDGKFDKYKIKIKRKTEKGYGAQFVSGSNKKISEYITKKQREHIQKSKR